MKREKQMKRSGADIKITLNHCGLVWTHCFVCAFWLNIGKAFFIGVSTTASSHATKDVKINHSLLCGPSSGLRMLLFISTPANTVEMEEVEKGVKNLSLQHSTVFVFDFFFLFCFVSSPEQSSELDEE
jgi:hypothetical protein